MSVPKTIKHKDFLECVYIKCTLYLHKSFFYLKINDSNTRIFEPFVSLGFVKSDPERILLYKTSLKEDLQEIMQKAEDYDNFCEMNDALSKKIDLMKIAEKKKNTLSKTLKINPIIHRLKENHPDFQMSKMNSTYIITIGEHKFIYDASNMADVMAHYKSNDSTPELIFVKEDLDLEKYLK